MSCFALKTTEHRVTPEAVTDYHVCCREMGYLQTSSPENIKFTLRAVVSSSKKCRAVEPPLPEMRKGTTVMQTAVQLIIPDGMRGIALKHFH